MRQPCDFVHKWNVNPLHTTAATLTVQTAITLCKYTMSFFGIFLASSKPLTAYLDLTILQIYNIIIYIIVFKKKYIKTNQNLLMYVDI